MDVTHVPSFGRTSFVPVTIDTASGFLVANAMTGETTIHTCRHLLFAFPLWACLILSRQTMALLIQDLDLHNSVLYGEFHTPLGFLTIHSVKLLLNVLIPP